jgi:hypothetical protein
MFNVFLPTFLEYRSEADTTGLSARDESPNSLSGPLWEVVIFTLGGCPGSLVSRDAEKTDLAPFDSNSS